LFKKSWDGPDTDFAGPRIRLRPDTGTGYPAGFSTQHSKSLVKYEEKKKTKTPGCEGFLFPNFPNTFGTGTVAFLFHQSSTGT
jgi:hypothetical protein